jgi:hypothetical protein
VASAVVAGIGAPRAAAQSLDMSRQASSERPRSELEHSAAILGLMRRINERGRRALADTDAGKLLRAYLASNPPRASVVDVAVVGGAGASSVDGGSGSTTLALDGRLTGDYCDIASAALSLRTDVTREHAVAELHASAGFCFRRGLGPDPATSEDGAISFFPLRARGEIAINSAPRFTGSRNQPRRRYAEVRYGLFTEGIRYWPREPHDAGGAFTYFELEQRWEWPGVFEGDRGFELIGGYGFFRLTRTRAPGALADRSIDVIDIRLHGMRFDEAEAVAIIELYPVRLRGVGLRSDRLLLDADLGIASTGGTITTSDCLDDVGCVDESITTGDNVAQVVTAVGRLGVFAGTRDSGGGLELQRQLDSNILGQVTVEDRMTASYQRIEGAALVRAAAFAGRATHFLDVDARGSERFAGAALDVGYGLGAGLWLGASLDGVAAWRRAPVLAGRVAGSGVGAFATLAWTHELDRRVIRPSVRR